MKETREVRRSLQRSSLFSGWLLRRRVFFWRLLRFITTPSSGGTVLARIRPDEAAEQHTALHARIAGQVIHLLAFAVVFVRTSPGAHVSFPDKFVFMPCALDCGARPSPNASCPVCARSEEHTSELQSPKDLVCRLLLEKKKKKEIDDAYKTRNRRDVGEKKTRWVR